MPQNAHPDSTFSSHVHNDWTYLQTKTTMSSAEEWAYVQMLMQPPKPGNRTEYPTPEQRGPVPENAHPDSNFSSHLHDDWTHVQLEATDTHRQLY